MFLWIPVTPVITADGCNDSGDKNDSGGAEPRRPAEGCDDWGDENDGE